MLNLIDVLDKQRFYPRMYVAALTDNMSLSRAATMEASMTSADVPTCKVGLITHICCKRLCCLKNSSMRLFLFVLSNVSSPPILY